MHDNEIEAMMNVERRAHPDAEEGVRAWGLGVPFTEGERLTGEARFRWEWGWKDADKGYRPVT